jgi:hypothetical protein
LRWATPPLVVPGLGSATYGVADAYDSSAITDVGWPVMSATLRISNGMTFSRTKYFSDILYLSFATFAAIVRAGQRSENRIGTVNASWSSGMLGGNDGSGWARSIIEMTSLSSSGCPELRTISRAKTRPSRLTRKFNVTTPSTRRACASLG